MRVMALILWAALFTGCTVKTPTTMRENRRHSYAVEVEGDWQQVQGSVVAAMIEVGWGEDVAIHQESHVEAKRASAWAYMPGQRDPIGFVVDVDDVGNGRARVTAYAESRYYAEKSREWLNLAD